MKETKNFFIQYFILLKVKCLFSFLLYPFFTTAIAFIPTLQNLSVSDTRSHLTVPTNCHRHITSRVQYIRSFCHNKTNILLKKRRRITKISVSMRYNSTLVYIVCIYLFPIAIIKTNILQENVNSSATMR